MADNGTRFIQEWRPILEPYAQKYNIPVEFMLTQLGQESGWGLHTPTGSNNYGGVIETRKGVAGVMADDAGRQRKFRKFVDKDDFANFWTGMLARRFGGVVGAKTIDEYTSALQGGKYKYAEDKNYAKNLASVLNTSVLPRMNAPATATATPAPTNSVNPAMGQVPPTAMQNATNGLVDLAVSGVNDWGLTPKFQQANQPRPQPDVYEQLFAPAQPQKTVSQAPNTLTDVSKQYGGVNIKWRD